MNRFTRIQLPVLTLVIAAGLFLACNMKTDGPDVAQMDPINDLGHQGCTLDTECLPSGYCAKAGCLTADTCPAKLGTCTADCRKTADCSLYGPGRVCVDARCRLSCMTDEPCAGIGFCQGAVMGTCSSKAATACAQDSDCPQPDPKTCRQAEDGDEAEGGEAVDDCAAVTCQGATLGVCAAECSDNDDCVAKGAGSTCTAFRCQGTVDGDQEEHETVVVKDCTYHPPEFCADHLFMPFCGDNSCIEEGWSWHCGEDGKCTSTGELDLGVPDESKPASQWTGIWGGVYTTAVTTTGLPIVGDTHTTTVHHVLFRLRQEGGNVHLDGKVCKMFMWKFKGETYMNDTSWMEIPEVYYKTVTITHNVIENAGELKDGTTFSSTQHDELRGAVMKDLSCEYDYERNGLSLKFDENNNVLGCKEKLADRNVYEQYKDDPDELAKYIWDQDEDTAPGMTTFMAGLLDGSVYSTQRYGFRLDGEVHEGSDGKIYLSGLFPSYCEQYQIAASDEGLLYETRTVPYNYDVNDGVGAPKDRNFFRLMRMPDDATCADVIAEGEKEGSWLGFSLHLPGVPLP